MDTRHDTLPPEHYRYVLEHMPLCCVDLVLVHEGKVLLLKQTRETSEEEWFVPGGRVFKNESLEQAALRKAREDTGLAVFIDKQLGIYETWFRTGPFPDLSTGVHTISVGFLVRPQDYPEGIVVRSSVPHKWITSSDLTLHPYLRKLIRDAQVF